MGAVDGLGRGLIGRPHVGVPEKVTVRVEKIVGNREKKKCFRTFHFRAPTKPRSDRWRKGRKIRFCQDLQGMCEVVAGEQGIGLGLGVEEVIDRRKVGTTADDLDGLFN